MKPLPKALLNSKFIFVFEDSSSPPLSQLYREPYRAVDRKNKYFKLHIGSKLDNISVDRLKPDFSDEKVSPALPPPHSYVSALLLTLLLGGSIVANYRISTTTYTLFLFTYKPLVTCIVSYTKYMLQALL